MRGEGEEEGRRRGNGSHERRGRGGREEKGEWKRGKRGRVGEGEERVGRIWRGRGEGREGREVWLVHF